MLVLGMWLKSKSMHETCIGFSPVHVVYQGKGGIKDAIKYTCTEFHHNLNCFVSLGGAQSVMLKGPCE